MKKTMRLFMVVLLGIFLLLAGGVVQAQAKAAIVIDEYGPGYTKNLAIPNAPWHVWDGALRPDPTWAGETSLSYFGARGEFLPGYFDVLVKDPSGADSDMLRFWNPPSNTLWTYVMFYSADIGGGAPADTGLPPAASWNVMYTVYEDSNGVFHWTSPLSGSEFTGYSEGHAPVPEPTTMLLVGLGLVGLAGVRRKFKQ
ncbi:MAG: PEP-CTERM sorting domain-containing protein [Syntrophales bacterium]|jgi:hypothetical protein